MEEERKMIVARTDFDQHAVEMGKWLAGYFDDAGYTDWMSTPHIFKAMIVGAFPPITPLDGTRVDYETVGIEKLYVGYEGVRSVTGEQDRDAEGQGKQFGRATKDKTQFMGITRMMSHIKPK